MAGDFLADGNAQAAARTNVACSKRLEQPLAQLWGNAWAAAGHNGLVGLLMRRFDFPTAPVVVGMILGPLAEAQLRNAMSIGDGKWTVFLERPMSAALMAVVVAVLVLPRVLKRRAAA